MSPRCTLAFSYAYAYIRSVNQALMYDNLIQLQCLEDHAVGSTKDYVTHCSECKQHTLSVCDSHLYATGLEGMAQNILFGELSHAISGEPQWDLFSVEIASFSLFVE